MSICVNVKTQRRIRPEEIFDSLDEKGMSVVVTNYEFPCLKFGVMQYSLRGIEVYEEDYGYEIQVCVGSNEYDYRCFCQTIHIVSALTNGSVFIEANEHVDNIGEFFDDAWIEHQMRSDCSFLYTLFRPSGEAIILLGLFAPICLGFQTLSIEGNDMWNPDFEKYKSMLEYLSLIQFAISDAEFAPHNLLVRNEENDAEEMGMTAIRISNNQVSQFDFVPFNPLVAFIDEDRKRSIVIPFKKLRYVTRNRGLHMFDDYQCGKCLAKLAKAQPVDVRDVRDMMNDAMHYQLKDLFYKPTYPGSGYDKQQRTYVLMWNPDSRSSDMSEEEYRMCISHIWPHKYDLLWDVSDCRSMRMGDRFFVVRNGQEINGIVMSGVFGSSAYFQRNYMNSFSVVLDFNFTVDYNEHPIVTIEQLKEAVPDFDWSRTFGNYKLKTNQAKSLEALFAPYFDSMKGKADGTTINATHYLS